MSETGPSIEHFIERFSEIKDKYSKDIYSKSFDKKAVKANIELIKDRRYAIEASIWKLEEEKSRDYILELLDVLNEEAKDYQKDIEIFIAAVNEDASFSKKILTDILSDRQKSVLNFAREKELSSEFIIFFSLVAAYPYREAVADYIHDQIDLSKHSSGFCPVCGHWPGVSYIVGKENHRIMSCIACGTRWSFPRMKCSFCLTQDQEQLSYLHVEDEHQVSAYTCDNCRRYVKTIKVEEESLEFPNEYVLVDYMSSGYIDLIAMQNKYIQESILSSRFDGPRDENIAQYWDQEGEPVNEEPKTIN